MSSKTLSKIYHDPKDPGSLDGVERFLIRSRQLHVPTETQNTIQKYLQSEQAYTLHKPARRRFIRNHTYVAGIDAQWQADQADMQGIFRTNGEIRYFLTVIYVFSKFAGAIPVYSKDAKAITAAITEVLTTANPRHSRRLQTDKGIEFFNSDFEALTKLHNIQHFASDSKQNAAVVNGYNRTIKTRIWTYLSDRGTVRWVNVIQNLIDAYNHSRNRSICMAPADV